MEDTMLNEHTMELLKEYNGNEDDTLQYLYDEIENCEDRKQRKDLVQQFNTLATEVNRARDFKAYKLLK